MAPSRSQTSLLSLLAASALLPLSSWAFDCNDIAAQGVHFNLGKLGGPHMVHWKEEDLGHDVMYKYNFTLDICNVLKWHKGGSLATECHHGAMVCAIRENVDLSMEGNSTFTPIDIAGTYKTQTGRELEAKFERLRSSKSNSDAGREGVRVELHGGRLPFDDKKNGLDQRAIVEFVCDKERTGLEGDEKDDGEHESDPKDDDKGGDDKKGDGKKEEKLRRREDGGKGKCEDNDHSLRFCGYEEESIAKDKNVKTLRLEWRTQYACEDAPAEDAGSHWGFFGWFFIIVFLAIASYLIFGSWLNYNRYGARGWDLLPHGDTIRDIPYIAKDFARKVMGTVQGSGGRGGYAAV
ncbi:autophagy protein-like protein Atg27 [Dothidotthia symphoricarpi CBS 119687]|uniref:Autophagy-related protein 27 n=1 Tax=Dothidotthia symphoricarpi CBS 119687 TaxID=1392245 RepID=A0A6A6A0J1_9PLEO|nr:autophagy protein-like protein Atg27 [Dothidotthia symphoricarpi CBS 119687]KAF2124664.1 autophagy protein-like protein Atg27 [Dothidotthia symphoricarpi CBS 119687]